MPPFFRNKRLIIILVSIIVLLALIGSSIRKRDHLTLPEQILKDTVGWVQNVFHTPAQFVSDFFGNIHEIKQTYHENEVLKARLSEYKDLLYQVQALKKENGELRKLLDKSDNMNGYKPIQATVIARSPERWSKQLTINKGMQHGVRANMAVITSDGMIGKVQSASQFTSSILLLSGFDRMNQVSVVVPGDKNIFGLIEGYNEDKKDLVLNIPFDADIQKGQMVVSSGMGGVFPKGLMIGIIEKVEMDRFSLTQTAYVHPSADLYEINNVMVVDRNAFSPVLDQESDADIPSQQQTQSQSSNNQQKGEGE